MAKMRADDSDEPIANADFADHTAFLASEHGFPSRVTWKIQHASRFDRKSRQDRVAEFPAPTQNAEIQISRFDAMRVAGFLRQKLGLIHAAAPAAIEIDFVQHDHIRIELPQLPSDLRQPRFAIAAVPIRLGQPASVGDIPGDDSQGFNRNRLGSCRIRVNHNSAGRREDAADEKRQENRHDREEKAEADEFHDFGSHPFIGKPGPRREKSESPKRLLLKIALLGWRMKIRFPGLALACLLIAGCNFSAQPERDLARLEALDARFQAGENDYALAEAKKYTDEFPDCDQGWKFRGWTHAEVDDYEMAVTCFNRAIELNPNADNAYVGLGVVRRAAGDLDGARQAYSEAIRILPENAEAFSSLLVIELLEKNYEKAVEYGERAWQLRKDHPTIPANLAVAYHYIGEDEKKQKFYREAEKLGYPSLDVIQEIFDGTMVVE